MENRIKRYELKHSLVKQIIFRIDYEGVIDNDIEDVIVKIRDSLYANEFTDLEERNEVQANIQFSSDILDTEYQSPIVNRKNNMVYVFKKNQFEEIALNKNYLELIINIIESYKSFDNYIVLIANIIAAFTETTKYFKMLRMGLKKVNICLIKSFDDINKVFSSKAYSLDGWLGSDKFEYIGNNNVTKLIHDRYNINYVRNILKGVTVENNDEVATFQLIVDIDVFADDIIYLKQICQDKNSVNNFLTKMNDIIFELFTDSLQYEFLEQLTHDKLSGEYDFIMGVN